jgi:trk system potassium uptake protein TrkH
MLPMATPRGISFADAFFTSTSAICVTGLIVNDTPQDFTIFGQIIIMLLVQLGGLGYMTSATIISLMLGKRIGLGERLIMKEALNVLSLEGVVKFTKAVILTALLFESIGTLLLTFRFAFEYPLGQAFFYGLFHSVSAFNNAGFSLFSDNLIRYRGDLIVNLVITTLIICGGIGFIVISDVALYSRKKVSRLSVHTKLVLSTTGILLALGTVLVFLFEFDNPKTFAGLPFHEQLLASYFASVTPRTAGFNTVDYSLFGFETLFLTIILMFIGASPGSTGGGVKTTTFSIILASLWSMLRGLRDVVLFNRRISPETTSKSLLLVSLAAIFIVIVTFLIMKTQGIAFLPAIFEVTSAFGTVGLSVGDGGARSLSALFSPFGKYLMSFMMFAGRLGPLTLAVAIISQKEAHFRYPEGKVIIG